MKFQGSLRPVILSIVTCAAGLGLQRTSAHAESADAKSKTGASVGMEVPRPYCSVRSDA